jgi:ribonuclease G
MPEANYVGVSKRIEDTAEKERLKQIALKARVDGMGLVVRTAAVGASAEELQKDVEYLHNLWQTLLKRYKLSQAPALLHRDADLIIRMVRDYLTNDITEFVIDNEEIYTRVVELAKNFSPHLAEVVKLYQTETNSQDIFTYYDLETELHKLNERRVDLKNGGYIIIDHTEALTAIDVNTGKYVGSTNLAQTVFETNLAAAAEIVRQIRLRDIGGMIIVDFIDMKDEEHKTKVLESLAEHLKKDRTKSALVGLTKLGLVEITRKKIRQNFNALMYHECPYCSGRGRVKSPESIIFDLKRELYKLHFKTSSGQLTIQVAPEVAEILKNPDILQEIKNYANKDLVIEPSTKIHPEIFSLSWQPL